MKYYIASRFSKKNIVRQISSQLVKIGHTITYDWTKTGVAERPYRSNHKNVANNKIASEALDGAAVADVFVLLSEPGMRGTYIEMGAYLQSKKIQRKSLVIYLIDYGGEEHIFESYGEAKVFANPKDLINYIESNNA